MEFLGLYLPCKLLAVLLLTNFTFSELCIIIIIVYTCDKDQQDVHFFLFISIKLSSTCFEQITGHHQEVCLYIVHLGNIHRSTPLEYIAQPLLP